jgi:hypothetical protein
MKGANYEAIFPILHVTLSDTLNVDYFLQVKEEISKEYNRKNYRSPFVKLTDILSYVVQLKLTLDCRLK